MAKQLNERLRHAAGQVAGGRIDRDAFEVIAGAVDQIAVLVGLEVAAPGEQVDAVEKRHNLAPRRPDAVADAEKVAERIRLALGYKPGFVTR